MEGTNSPINGINFTPREIDVLACLLGGRTATKIASFLSVSSRTIENHISHIMLKVGCNSRESIKDFLASSDQLAYLQNHYLDLSFQIVFERKLKEVAADNLKEMPSCSIIHWVEGKNHTLLLSQLKRHLKIAGIRITLETRKEAVTLNQFLEEAENTSDELRLFSIPQDLKESLQRDKKASKLTICQPPIEEIQEIYSFLLHQNKKNIIINFSKSFPYQRDAQKNYYFSFVKILKYLFPKHNFEALLSRIEAHYERKTEISSQNQPDNASSSQKPIRKTTKIIDQLLRNRKWIFAILILASVNTGVCFWILDNRTPNLPHISNIPTPDNLLLKRSKIIAEIDEKLKGHNNIQTVALVATGGAGKTTLARQYALQQKANVIWEINAETSENLRNSFEKLAQKLAATEEDKKQLKIIQVIKDFEERQEKILEFVKEHLRTHLIWFLIYDNVGKFMDIQKYFPLDSKNWGYGKIILTTRDNTIKNNSQINSIIDVEELTTTQKLDLFKAIMNHGSNSSDINPKVLKFLEQIPSFPLDVTVAAYYLKSTGISYEKYLENLKNYSNDFNAEQKEQLEAAGEYDKTRYSIIVQSLEHVIQNNKAFEELFLFISLLDSQNIPRDLLEKYKTNAILDSFISHLKKHSLITSTPSPSSTEVMLSIHRSAQSIILVYLTKKLNLENNKKLVQGIGKTLENYITDKIENFDYPRMRFLISHSEMFLKHENLLTDPIRGALSVGIGGMYTYFSLPQKAQNTLEMARKILNKNPAENHDRIATALYFLGLNYWDLADFQQSKLLLEQSRMMYQKYFSANHLGVARASVTLAHVTRELGDYEKSKNLVEEALSIYNRYYLENHVRIAWTLSFLGAAYYELGKYEKAKEVLEKALGKYQKYYPQHYLGQHRIYAFLGLVHWKLGDYEKAIDCIKMSIQTGEKQLVKHYYGIEWTRTTLGNIYRDAGDYKKAKKLLENGRIFREKFYGKEHFQTAKILRDLGQLYLLEGDIKAAENLFTKSLNLFQKNKHIDIYTILESFSDLCLKKSSLLDKQGDIQQSEQCKRQALDYLKQALDIVHAHFPVDSAHRVRIQAKIKSLTGK